MAAPVFHIIHGNTFWLLSQKALFWEERKTLILSDLHLGKTGHFRKAGIPVPQGVYKNDLHRLFHIIQYYKPEQLIIAGDMFHSKMNREVDQFTRWRKDLSQLHIQLIKGNHDILHNDNYAEAEITVSDCSLHVDGFCFVHDIQDVKDDTDKGAGSSTYYFSGHIHPGIHVRSGRHQSVCLPCYYFTTSYAVLPAFSAFTGLFGITPKKNESVFAIVNETVMKVGK